MKRIKCEECGGKIIRKSVKYSIYGVEIGKFPAEVCIKCKETCFSEETSREITKRTKKLELWGLESKTKLGMAGSTLDIRLSKNLINFFKLKKGEEVTIYPENKHRLVVDIQK